MTVNPDDLPWLAAVDGPLTVSGGVVTATGWCVGPGARPRPRVSLSGMPATLEVHPVEVAPAGIPEGWPVSRWQAAAEVADPEQVTVAVLGPDGEPLCIRDLRPDGATVPQARYDIDQPKAAATVRGDLLVVTGWLVLDGAMASRVQVCVDGLAPVDARVALPRLDLAPAMDSRDITAAGFEAHVPLDLAPGRSRPIAVRLRGHTPDGRVWLSPVRECTADNPAGEGTLGGWAETVTRGDPDHVLVVAHSLRVGGGELWLYELLRRLTADHGMKVTVVAPEDGPLHGDLDALGVAVVLSGEYDVREVAPYERHVRRLAELMTASGAGSVLVNTLGMFAGVDAARRAGLPVAWTIHESFGLADFSYLNWGFAGLAAPVRRRWEQCLQAADALLFVADATREMFLPHAPAKRCHTVRYGIDLAAAAVTDRATARARLGLPADAQVLLSVGVSEPRKGHVLLLTAFEQVRLRHPDTHLVIVGLHTSLYCDGLRALVRARGLAEHVTLVPIARDPSPWFAAADLFVNSSDIESLPRTILEAVAGGLPVVAADVFGARELVVDGVTGWLLAANDQAALTTGLLRALDTPGPVRARMAAAARERIEPFLDSAGYGTTYAAILRGLGGTAPFDKDPTMDEIESLRRDRDEARAELRRLRAERDQLAVRLLSADETAPAPADATELADLRAKAAELAALAARLRTELEATRATLSWRITAPLRAVRSRR